LPASSETSVIGSAAAEPPDGNERHSAAAHASTPSTERTVSLNLLLTLLPLVAVLPVLVFALVLLT
jgi:hypothetical protein